MWNFRVLCVGSSCVILGYCVWEDMCGFVGHWLFEKLVEIQGILIWREVCS